MVYIEVMQGRRRTEVEIRRLDAHDWRTYRDLRLASLIDSPRTFATSYAGASARPDSHWRSFVEADRAILVAFDHLRPCGMCVLDPTPQRGQGVLSLFQMWVAAGDRQRGVGSQLIGAAVGEARQRGARGIVLEVYASNYGAASLYQGLGFVPTGRSTELAGDPDRRVIELGLPVRRDSPTRRR